MDNPFEVAADQPLDIVVHKGGYGDDYVISAEARYRERFPAAPVRHEGVQDVKGRLAGRFADGNPPDLVSSAGRFTLDIGGLAARRQLLDLAPLLDAPSFDDPDRPVRDTLRPGTVEAGAYGDACYTLNYGYNVYGIWRSRALFDRHGWPDPTTWDEMLALCAEIRGAGVTPWIYQSMYPAYFMYPILAMAAKTGGRQVLVDIDNLEPGAWRADAVVAAAEAFHDLARRGYLAGNDEPITHLDAQRRWLRGEAAFLPCGSWLENEMAAETPPDFDLAMSPTPSLTATDALPRRAVLAIAAEPFFVPADAANPRGGLELLRIMLSRRISRGFAERTGAFNSVVDGSAGVGGNPGFRSASAALAEAGDDTLHFHFFIRYLDMYLAMGVAIRELLAGRTTPRRWSETCQALADEAAADDRLLKVRR
ncbi:N-acetylglucosamine/diacetylchitobiose ABC transporter substrate-binding protein [Actinosynnema sp. NPDC059335]|uniref:N-acetylglucosamine/diacetylchitobiose ABC transporter substrate-binding protein n=1 Tax=Actinosynnema sp. NPDC059335 TaxID=3346804 RepID=UPI00366F6843